MREYPQTPDWKSLGFPPKPTPIVSRDYSPFPEPPAIDYERAMKAWIANLSPWQKKIYSLYQSQIHDWFKDARDEVAEIEKAEFEKFGLEWGVNSDDQLDVARSMSILNGILMRLRQETEAEDANEQFEQFFRHQSET